MSDHSFFNSSVPQFGTAEYARKPGAETCQSCGAAISDRYFRINGALACPICASEAQAKAPKDTHVAFVRGLTFGIGGAMLAGAGKLLLRVRKGNCETSHSPFGNIFIFLDHRRALGPQSAPVLGLIERQVHLAIE